jgi:flagellar FliJ protein
VTSPPFAFRLERVRSLREQAEDRAREELAAGLAHRLRGEALLREATRVAAEARAAAHGAVLAGASGADLQAAQAWLDRVEQRRQAAALDLHRRDAEVDARRTVLARASRDHEVVSRLRDRARADHERAALRREQSDLDEIALSTFRRTGTAA